MSTLTNSFKLKLDLHNEEKKLDSLIYEKDQLERMFARLGKTSEVQKTEEKQQEADNFSLQLFSIFLIAFICVIVFLLLPLGLNKSTSTTPAESIPIAFTVFIGLYLWRMKNGEGSETKLEYHTNDTEIISIYDFIEIRKCLYKRIKTSKRRIRFFKAKLLYNYKINIRSSFRRLFHFLFKNLDDYSAGYIFHSLNNNVVIYNHINQNNHAVFNRYTQINKRNKYDFKV